MKKSILSALLTTLIISSAFCQKQDEISMAYSSWSGVSFTQNGTSYTFKDAIPLMQSNPEAYQMLKSAKSSSDFANVLGFAGGFMVGWPLGTAIGGGNPNWTLAAIGAGLIVIAIPVSGGAKKKAEAAVDKYNTDLNAISQNNYKPKLEFASMRTGIGFRLTF